MSSSAIADFLALFFFIFKNKLYTSYNLNLMMQLFRLLCNVCYHYFIFMVGNEDNTNRKFNPMYSIKVDFNKCTTHNKYEQKVSMINSMKMTVR